MPLMCSVFGHRVRFRAEGDTMHWHCDRGCGVEGSKRYSSPVAAAHYAAALDREDADDLGRRAPLSLSPLRLARRGR